MDRLGVSSLDAGGRRPRRRGRCGRVSLGCASDRGARHRCGSCRPSFMRHECQAIRFSVWFLDRAEGAWVWRRQGWQSPRWADICRRRTHVVDWESPTRAMQQISLAPIRRRPSTATRAWDGSLAGARSGPERGGSSLPGVSFGSPGERPSRSAIFTRASPRGREQPSSRDPLTDFRATGPAVARHSMAIRGAESIDCSRSWKTCWRIDLPLWTTRG